MNNITEHLHRFEDLAVDVLAVFGPWLAPIPSAYLVGKAAVDHLAWHMTIAIIAAIAVESIGVVSIVLSLRLYEWNETKNKTDPAAPLPLALFAAFFYFVVTIGLTVVLDVVPEWSRYAPAIFPLLAAVGAANIAMKNGQRRREREKTKSKVQRNLPKVSGKKVPKLTESSRGFTHWRTIPQATRMQFADMTPEEIHDKNPQVTLRTCQNWHDNATKLTLKLSLNGAAK
jgi:hypothetical protein